MIEVTNRIPVLIFSIVMIAFSFILGILVKKRTEKEGGFFGAAGMFGPVAVGLSTVASAASAFAIVGMPGLYSQIGFGIAWWMLGSFIFAITFICIAKKVSALTTVGKVKSLGDLSDLLYNSRYIKILMTLVLLVGSIAYLSSQVLAGSLLFSNLLGLENTWIAALILFGCIIGYMVVSGEAGGLVTQAFQGFIMALAGIAVIISFYSITGGFSNVFESIQKFNSTAPEGEALPALDAFGSVGPATALAWFVIGIIGYIAQPQGITRLIALKSPLDAPRMGIVAGLAHGLVALLTIVVAMGIFYMISNGLIENEKFGDQTTFVFVEHSGIFVRMMLYAGTLAATMSSASVFMGILANIIARDLPGAFGKEMNPKKQILVGRVAMILIGLISIVFALSSGDLVAIMGAFGYATYASGMFGPFILGLLWPRINAQGVSVGLTLAFVLSFIEMLNKANIGLDIAWPGTFNLFCLCLTVVSTIVVSLVTKPKELSRPVQAALEL